MADFDMLRRMGGACRTWLWVALFGTSVAGCQCFVPLAEPDGGLADAGRPVTADASVADAGNDSGIRDAGGFDAGEIDAGASDAAVADAGVIDGGSDSGMVAFDASISDAGLADAGSDSGIVMFDAGPGDSGTPEACNGVDDDGDGRIDLFPDGGVLTQACPLTLGVCAGAVSVCRDGGFTACDYGPNYQRTERNCDGLDNDCDGRIDRSWTRTLFERDDGGTRVGPCSGDTNAVSSLCYSDVASQQVIPQPQGILLSTPAHFTTITDDLEIAHDVVIPRGPDEVALFPGNTGEWWRAVWLNAETSAPRCAALHVVRADGGFDHAPDGGIAFLATVCPTFVSWTSVGFRRGDVGIDALFVENTTTQTQPQIAWAHLARDGGSSLVTASVDAGPAISYWTNIVAVDGGFVFGREENGPVQYFSVGPDLVPAPFALLPLPECTFTLGNPPSFWCQDLAVSGLHSYWYVGDGGILWDTIGGSSGQLAWSRAGFSSDRIIGGISLPDGGAAFGVISSAGFTAFDFDVLRSARGPHVVQFTQLGPHLHVATWIRSVSSGACPSCEIDGFVAEYVCVP